MLIGEAVGQCNTQLGRDAAGGEFADKLTHADEEFAGREFGEGHRRDRFGGYAFGQHQGDAAGHDRGLSRARAGLDQEGAIMNRDGVAAGSVIGERFHRRGHH